MSNFQNLIGVKIAQGVLPTTGISVFAVVPPNSQFYLKDIDFCNTGAASTNISLFIVPTGVSSATVIATPSKYALYYGTTIAANGTLAWRGTQILNAGDSIQGFASAAGCTIIMSGAQAT